MGNVAFLIVAIVAFVTSAFRALLPEVESVMGTSQVTDSKVTEVNISCYLETNCTLPCHFGGVLTEVQWFKGRESVPIAFYPENSQLHRHQNFTENISLSVNLTTGDASLLLKGVQMWHQGTYRCYNSSNGRGGADRLVHLSVHSESFDKRDFSNLRFLALLLLLIPAGALVWYCHRKEHRQYTLTKREYVQGTNAQNPGGGTSNQGSHQNGQIGLSRGNNIRSVSTAHTVNMLVNGDVETSL